jgi:hypothetical protein
MKEAIRGRSLRGGLAGMLGVLLATAACGTATSENALLLDPDCANPANVIENTYADAVEGMTIFFGNPQNMNGSIVSQAVARVKDGRLAVETFNGKPAIEPIANGQQVTTARAIFHVTARSHDGEIDISIRGFCPPPTPPSPNLE